MKLVRTTGRIQVLDLMAVAMDCTVGGPVVSDAARRVKSEALVQTPNSADASSPP